MHDTTSGLAPPDATVCLPQHLDISVCQDLTEQLLSLRNTKVCVSAAEVSFVGALALQLLLSARLLWQNDGHSFRVIDPSNAFCDGLALLGYSEFPFEDVSAA